jgi:hypothetical protein
MSYIKLNKLNQVAELTRRYSKKYGKKTHSRKYGNTKKSLFAALTVLGQELHRSILQQKVHHLLA